MRLRADDRGVTVQIGTVLLFAVLVVLISTYQATVVPQQNERVEYNHNQQVHGELQDLRDELRRTAVTDSGGTTSISLGTRFPERAFFVNPAPPSGTLATTSEENVRIENAVASDETRDYWDGNARSFATESLVYRPQYSLYQDAPTTIYDNGVLYNQFADANVTLAGQRLVEGNRISLVTLDGNLSESSNRAASVDIRPVSAATRTVTVRNKENESVTLVVPTNRNASEWGELLDGELDKEGDDADKRVQAVNNTTTADGKNAVRITLEPGTYELEMAKVGVGTDVSGVEAHYLTDVRGDNESVAAGGTQRLVVEARDEYNNPVSGVRVNVSGVSAGSVTPKRAETGSDGRATFVYEAPDQAGTETVAFNISGDPEPREEATVRLHVGAGGSAGDGGAFEVRWTDATGAGLDCDAAMTACTLHVDRWDGGSLTANVSDGGDSDADPLSQASVDYSVNDSSLAGVSPTVGETDERGGHAVDLVDLASETGNVTVWAEAGGDADPVRIRLVDGEEAGVRDPGFAYEDADHDGQYVESVDARIPNAEITDGSYDATANDSSLVVPRSVGDIDAARIDLAGRNVTVGVNLTATAHDGNLTVEATDDVSVAGTALATQGYEQGVDVAAGGSVSAAQTAVTSHGQVNVTAAGDVDLRRASVDATAEYDMPIEVTSRNGDVDASRASFAAQSGITLDARSGDVSAVESSLDTTAAYDMQVVVTASGTVDLTDVTAASSGSVSVTADGGDLVATGAQVDTSGEYGMDIALTARDDIHVDESTLRTDTAELTARVTGTPPSRRTVYVAGATFRDANNRLDVSPDGVQISGPSEKTE